MNHLNHKQIRAITTAVLDRKTVLVYAKSEAQAKEYITQLSKLFNEPWMLKLLTVDFPRPLEGDLNNEL